LSVLTLAVVMCMMLLQAMVDATEDLVEGLYQIGDHQSYVSFISYIILLHSLGYVHVAAC
jgi:hypothetical protein